MNNEFNNEINNTNPTEQASNTPAEEPKKKKKKGLIIFLIILAVVLLIGISAVTVLNQVGKRAMHDYEDMTVAPNTEVVNEEDVKDDGKTITYNGETYKFNEDVTTLVLLGIDAKDSEEPDRQVGHGGYADAIYLAVIDTSADKVSIVSVSRNAMVDVDILNKDYEYVETDNMQICLSYAYGDSKEKSVDNTILSLERLFKGIEFDTYYSISQKAVEELNDSVGGVTLDPIVSFYSVNEHAYIQPGKPFTLLGHDSIMYIRSNEWDDSEIEPEANRIKRQEQYMEHFLSQVWPAVTKDSTVITDMYNSIVDNTTTNLDASKFTYLATTALTSINDSKIEYLNVPGEYKAGKKDYDKFYVDEEKLMELMLDLFYVKAE